MTSADDLLSLVYTSTASQPFRTTALEHLLEECRRFNGEHDITGMLLYRDGRFIQVLEGPRSAVMSLAARIEGDQRHHDMRILLREPIAQRSFSEWTMGYHAFRSDSGTAPSGYRDSFTDLESGADAATVNRALFELTLWFRVRTQVPTV